MSEKYVAMQCYLDREFYFFNNSNMYQIKKKYYRMFTQEQDEEETITIDVTFPDVPCNVYFQKIKCITFIVLCLK